MAFGCFDAVVAGAFTYNHVQQIGAVELEQVRDVILKGIKTSLMFGPGGGSIYPNFRVGHDALKNYSDPLFSPEFRGRKCVSVFALFVGFIGIVAVIILAKTLELPIRWHRNSSPKAALSPTGAVKCPRYSIIFAPAGKINSGGSCRVNIFQPMFGNCLQISKIIAA